MVLAHFFFFFFNDTATTEIYTLSLHDALPILQHEGVNRGHSWYTRRCRRTQDRKSTRLNSSHGYISYAVFCLKKKKKRKNREPVARATIRCAAAWIAVSCV